MWRKEQTRRCHLSPSFLFPSQQQERLVDWDSISEFQCSSSQEPCNLAISRADLLPTWSEAHVFSPWRTCSSAKLICLTSVGSLIHCHASKWRTQQSRWQMWQVNFNHGGKFWFLYVHMCVCLKRLQNLIMVIYVFKTVDLVCCEQGKRYNRAKSLSYIDNQKIKQCGLQGVTYDSTHSFVESVVTQGQPVIFKLKPRHNLRDLMRPAISFSFYLPSLNSISLPLLQSFFLIRWDFIRPLLSVTTIGCEISEVKRVGTTVSVALISPSTFTDVWVVSEKRRKASQRTYQRPV